MIHIKSFPMVIFLLSDKKQEALNVWGMIVLNCWGVLPRHVVKMEKFIA